MTSHIASKNNYCNMKQCVGEVLLKQWKPGNTCVSITRERPLEIEVFFLYKDYLEMFIAIILAT